VGGRRPPDRPLIVPQAVLLDLYGTLVEPDWPRLIAGRHALADAAGVPHEPAYAAWTASHDDRMRGAFGSLERDLAHVFAMAAGEGGVPIDDPRLAELAATERASWCASVHLYDDVVPTLAALRAAGMRLAIVTNSSAEAASVIPHLGLDRLVDLVVASCDVGALKPRTFELALAGLGLDASDAVLIDDDPAEVLAAERMGLPAVLIRRPGPDTRDPVVHPPDGDRRAVTSLDEAARLLLGASPALR
jgi:HAD superfamily hydrolase (TIGR01509 family)